MHISRVSYTTPDRQQRPLEPKASPAAMLAADVVAHEMADGVRWLSSALYGRFSVDTATGDTEKGVRSNALGVLCCYDVCGSRFSTGRRRSANAGPMCHIHLRLT